MKTYENYCYQNNYTLSEYALYLLMVILPTYNRLSEYLDITKNYISKYKMLEIYNEYYDIYKIKKDLPKDTRYSIMRINSECKSIIEKYMNTYFVEYKAYKLTQTLTQLHNFNCNFIASKMYKSDFTKTVGDDSKCQKVYISNHF